MLTLQKKALRIVNVAPYRSHASPLFKTCNILKFNDNINLQNFLFAYDTIHDNLPSSLTGQLTLVNTGLNTRSVSYYQLNNPFSRTKLYGTNSIKSKSIHIWNQVNYNNHQKKLWDLSRNVCKKFVSKLFLDSY